MNKEKQTKEPQIGFKESVVPFEVWKNSIALGKTPFGIDIFVEKVYGGSHRKLLLESASNESSGLICPSSVYVGKNPQPSGAQNVSKKTGQTFMRYRIFSPSIMYVNDTDHNFSQHNIVYYCNDSDSRDFSDCFKPLEGYTDSLNRKSCMMIIMDLWDQHADYSWEHFTNYHLDSNRICNLTERHDQALRSTETLDMIESILCHGFLKESEGKDEAEQLFSELGFYALSYMHNKMNPETMKMFFTFLQKDNVAKKVSKSIVKLLATK